MLRHLPLSLLALYFALFLPAALRATPDRALPVPALLKTNGGWCWFQDERALVIGDTLLFGSVAGSTRGPSAAGDIDATTVDLRSGRTHTTTLHPKFQSDDHDVPAFLALPDGRVLATYQSHGGDKKFIGLDLMRWRRTVRPGDFTEWTPEQTLPVGAGVSYSNLFRLGAEGGRIYNFHRGLGYNPNYLISTDDGATFTYGGRLLSWPRPVGEPLATGIDGGRPYLKYVQAGEDTIHLIATDDHPRAYDNSIYHAFIRGGKIHHSDGRVIAPLSTTGEAAIAPRDLTTVFQGDAHHVAWMCDVHLDRAGHPRIIFSVQRDGAKGRGVRDIKIDGQDHRFYHARWDGAHWLVHEIAHAGSRLYAGEDDYTGLAAIDPQNPSVVYISTNTDPKTGAPLISTADQKRHWEIYRGLTTDDGATFTWTPLTQNSASDNLRPIVPLWKEAQGRTILLWLRGTYRRYTDYDLDVVGLLPST